MKIDGFGRTCLQDLTEALQKLGREPEPEREPEKVGGAHPDKSTAVMNLMLVEFFDRAFVEEVLDRKRVNTESKRDQILRSRTSMTIACTQLPAALERTLGEVPRVSHLATFSPTELRQLAKLDDKSMRWTEEYLHMFNITLPKTESVYGMRPEAQRVLASLM